MSTPLLGRDAACELLADALADAVAGRGGLLWFSGDAGIGKTRLLAELEGLAGLADAAVLHGSGWEDPGTPPFWLWTQVLRDAASLTDDDTWGPEACALLARSSANVDVADRFPLFDSVARVVTRLADDRPVVVILDDLHWADLGSLRLLRFVATVSATARVLLACAWRSGEAPTPAEAAELVARARVIELQGLGQGDVTDLIEAASGLRVADADAAAVIAQTGGNPLFVEQMARLARARGRTTVAGTVPASAYAVIERRVARLSQRCHDLLIAVAVCGPDARLDLVAGLVPDNAIDLITVVDEAADAGLLTGSADRVSFTHALFREAVYSAAPTARRRALHLNAADRLEDSGAPAAEIAGHLLAALPLVSPDRLIVVGEAAARSAAAVQAYEDAADLYRRVLDALPDGHAVRPRLLLSQAECLLMSGDLERARPAFKAAADLARRRDDPVAFARAALGFAAGVAGFEVRLRDELQLDLLKEALGRLSEGDSELRAYTLARLSVALAYSVSIGERATLAEEAVAMCRRLGLVSPLAHALSAWCDAFAGPADSEQREHAASEIIALAQTARDRPLELLGLRHRIVARLERGETGLAEHDMHAFARIADDLRQPLYSWYVPIWRGLLAQLRGDFEDMSRSTDEAARIGALVGSRNAVALTITQRIHAAYDRLQFTELERLVAQMSDEILEMAPDDGSILAIFPGRPEHVRKAFLPYLERTVRDLPVDAEWLTMLCVITLTLFENREAPEYAADVRDRLAPFRHRFAIDGIGAGSFGSVERQLGMLASLLDEHDAAADHFVRALAADRAAGSPLHVATTHRAHGIMFLRRGDAESARPHLQRAEQDYRRLGMAERAAEVATLLAGPDRLATSNTGSPTGDICGDCVFCRDGTGWRVTYAGRTTILKHAKGMGDLAVLLASPGREAHVLDLAGSFGAPMQGDLGPVIDDRAKAAFRERLAELAQAADAGDVAAGEERAALMAELSANYGLGGRTRRTGAAAERARSAVTRRIREAIAAIEMQHAVLGRHLRASVRTGTFCSYVPEQERHWLTS